MAPRGSGDRYPFVRKVRKRVGGRTTRDILIDQGHPELAARVHRFLDDMPPPQTEKEHRAATLLQRSRESSVTPRTL